MLDYRFLTMRAKRLLEQNHVRITDHVLFDHPERQIEVSNIYFCLRVGSIAGLEPRKVLGLVKYGGLNRYRWYGEDGSGHVLRLILVFDRDLIVVSAAVANTKQRG